ncbi:MAG: Gfo/Idh/MocA family oxidoreductase [Acidobacteria bacterium]|nr:Gfo/Idh/MocA family oxidoreductase [Acidobacteriota bacterium]MBK9705907.1 Gfo/Idh/MocA family oxidoreductase [Acidobacteriota bacterium]
MNKLTRRDFAKSGIVAGTGTAISRMNIMGANDRINIGLIGCGDRAMQIYPIFLKEAGVNPVAVSDVYQPYLDKAVAASGKPVAKHEDFRRLLEIKEIDAVVIATPDHWHALNTIMACQAGKDVYVEKPMSLTILEGRKMVEAARKNNRVVQNGSQQRSGPHYQEAVKLIRDGAIGPVHKITVGYTRNSMPGLKPLGELGKELPKTLNWDMWLGPAPYVPFDPFRCHYNFRWFWDYSGGQMTNWGAHNLDIARWALNARGPSAVAAFGGRYAINDGGETPDVQEVIYNFPNCVVTWSGREVNRTRDEYLSFQGTKGTLSILRDGFTIAPETWRKKETPEIAPMQMKGDGKESQVLHIRNFLDCMRSRKRPVADVEEGHLTATMCHMGNIATRLGRSLKWDARKEEFISDAEANKMLSTEYRKPWRLE